MLNELCVQCGKPDREDPLDDGLPVELFKEHTLNSKSLRLLSQRDYRPEDNERFIHDRCWHAYKTKLTRELKTRE